MEISLQLIWFNGQQHLHYIIFCDVAAISVLGRHVEQSHIMKYINMENFQEQLEQLERLRSEDTPRRLMITHTIMTIESCWIPSQHKVKWPWRYRSRSKVITCDTTSHASDHLYQIWKECKQNCSFFSRWNLQKIEILEFCYKLNTRHTL